MDRLKKEWKETQIPEEAYLRARNAAWARMQRQTPARQRLIWASAVSMLIIAAAVIWIWRSRESQIDLVSTPAKPDIIAPEKAAIQTAGLHTENPEVHPPQPVAAQPARVKRSGSSRHVPVSETKEPESDHIVLNMVLPETKAHMIWIMDSSFHF